MSKRKLSPEAKREHTAPSGSDWTKNATDEFVRGLIIRGEAANPRPDGSLPPGATHAIIGVDERGMPRVERRRYSNL